MSEPLLRVARPGTLTTLQEWPGRIGYWSVGVPPSGPMDDLAFRAGNTMLGNEPGAGGLELTLSGPTLHALSPLTVTVTGALLDVTVDGEPVPMWQPIALGEGAQLRLGRIRGPGMRAYVLIGGGVRGEAVLGSAATFIAGGFGKPLVAGQELSRAIGPPPAHAPGAAGAPTQWSCGTPWTLSVTLGPQGAPDPFGAADLERLLAADWTVHHHSDRTGVRLAGPTPVWARADGGEAGLHPSNLHDNPYAPGAVTFAGDQPLIIGPDGPSLGGFVAPACVIAAERWKLGQLRPGDTVRFAVVSLGEADDAAQGGPRRPGASPAKAVGRGRVLAHATVESDGTGVVMQATGDRHVLVEFGAPELDLAMRVHAHSLRVALDGCDGIADLTEGIRSLQVHFDPAAVARAGLLELLAGLVSELPDPGSVEIAAREIELPLSFDDPAAQLAVDRYADTVRADAPWCPSNLEFIRRINGLNDVAEVRSIVFEATYLVMGLGDVYLGAPVAVPLDPRHRLVTTKYTPPRTWTPENAVGIGGSYLCVYGIEGPGGYQLLGRTIQMWDRHGRSPDFEPGRPWLLRPFDQLRFTPVDAAELECLREDFAAGRHRLRMGERRFSLSAVRRPLREAQAEIDEVLRHRRRAFHAERRRWREALTA